MIRAGALLIILLAAACGDPYKYDREDRTDRRPRDLQVTHTVGGVHWCALGYAGGWYQGYGHRLLSLGARTGDVLCSIEPVPAGHGGPVQSLVAWRGDLYAVVERSALVRIDVRDPKDLAVMEVSDSAALGLEPEAVSVVDDRLFVSGVGGVLELPSGKRYLQGRDASGEVVQVGTELVVLVGNDLTALDGADMRIEASSIIPLPTGVGPAGGAILLEQTSSGSFVSLVDHAFSELDKVALGRGILTVSIAAGRAWAFTPTSMFTWSIQPTAFTDELEIKVKGAYGIELLGLNRYAVFGAFGRSLFRLETDEEGPGDTFHRSQREPGQIVIALSDQRRILAGTPTEAWSYTVGGDCELIQKTLQVGEMPRDSLDLEGGRATIEGDDRTTLLVELPGSRQEFHLPRISTIAAVGTDLWVAHADGLTVYRRVGESQHEPDARAVEATATEGTGVHEVASLRLPGPITHVFPRRAGQGASYVSGLGGMGTTEWKPVGELQNTNAGK